ncbi:pyridoxamine 5'-phosphate oxidase family protein [Haloferax namakaokahaiae]|uniref:Pyridoxamine 5'-phosphate oxidase family protein n=1 Tax=Haloferax namakaokahaiae TaxID=1748331 RepID=A0ABD5ZH90_9EURY
MVPDFAELSGTEMDDEDIARLLRDEGVGVLSLADEGVAYGIPLSFGYDEANGSLYFVFLRPGETSKKVSFAEQTERACFTVWTAASRHEWRSVVLDGTLHPIEDHDWDRVQETLGDNAWYPSLFSEVEPMQDILGWEFRIEEQSGQQSREI